MRWPGADRRELFRMTQRDDWAAARVRAATVRILGLDPTSGVLRC